MLIYWVLFSILTFIAAGTYFRVGDDLNKICLSVSFLLILLLVGLRDQTGNDWYPYLDYYESLETNIAIENHFEFGYELYSKLFNYLGLTYPIFLFLSTFIYLSILFHVFLKNKYPNILVLLFYSSYLLGLMGTARQVLALAICLLAAQFLLDGKRLIFYFLVFIAALFHKSAIIFMLASFFVKIDLKVKNYIYLIITAVFVNLALNYILPFIENISIFSQTISNQLSVYLATKDTNPIYYIDDIYLKLLMFVKRILFALLFIASRKLIKKYKYQYNFFLNCYIFSLLIFISLYSIFPAIAVRASLYFYIYDIFLFCILLFNLSGKYKLIFFIFIIIASAQRLFTLFDYNSDFLLPYKGIFINESTFKDMPR